MATINTIDDLLRIVRENDEYRVALRRELLTDDLLALPAQFAEMRDTQNSMLETQSQILRDLAEMRAQFAEMRDTQNSMLETQNQMLETQNRILRDLAETRSIQNQMLETQNQMLETQSHILRDLAETRATQNQMRETQIDILKTQNEILRRLGNVESHNRRLSNDFGAFRGNYAGVAVVKHAAAIAFSLDEAKSLGIVETEMKILSFQDLLSLAREYGTERLASIPRSERESFYLSDLIIETAKTDGTACYIAVEASYTCNGRDTARALAHADLLTRFTGKEAWPVIAGVRMDRQIRSLVDHGQVFWYPLEYREMEPEEPL